MQPSIPKQSNSYSQLCENFNFVSTRSIGVVSHSDGSRKIGKQLTGKDAEGNACGLIGGAITAFTREGWVKIPVKLR
jgi:hypothetical protein